MVNVDKNNYLMAIRNWNVLMAIKSHQILKNIFSWPLNNTFHDNINLLAIN